MQHVQVAITPGGHIEATETLVAGVRLTHPDRVLYPEQGVTKSRLAEYYEAMAAWILPHLRDRPLSVVRCPEGRTGECFYQKHVGSLPEGVDRIDVREKESGEVAAYIAVSDVAALVSLVQYGVLELHPWGARGDALEKPDRVIFDLDPGPGADFELVVAGARKLRQRLAGCGLESFVRTTGGKGLHVVVPIQRRRTWDEVRAFARAVARGIADDEPGSYVVQADKSARRGKVFIDYLRNGFGATAVASYSTRRRPGAPVAANLRWNELGDISGGDVYDVVSIRRRVAHLQEEPWNGFVDLRQSISARDLKDVCE